MESEYHPVSIDRARALLTSGRGGNIKLDQIPAAIRPVSIHDFGGPAGSAFTQRFSSAAQNQIDFQWDEPFFLGGVKTDFNVYVFDADGNWMDPSSASFPGFYTTDDNTKTDEPFEYLYLPPMPLEVHGGANVTDWQIVIGNMNGGPARHLKYINLNGLGVSERQGAPSLFGHAAARGGQAVAATYYAIPGFAEDFSSPGPTTIYLDEAGQRLRFPEVRGVPQLTAADGVDTTFFGFDSDLNGWPNFFGTSAAAPDAAAVAALVLQAAGGPGSLSPRSVYGILQRTATSIPLPDDRSWSAALAGPLVFTAGGDWTRWNRYFRLDFAPFGGRKVTSVALDLTPTSLIWSSNPNRFSVGEAIGLVASDITVTRSADGKVLTLGVSAGNFTPGDSLKFGESVFDPLQGSTQEDPDRLRGMKIRVTFENGTSASGTVFAGVRLPLNRFAGFGLVNADAATRAAARSGRH